MYLAGSEENKHHVSVYGPVTKFGYKDFIPMFKAQHYDPQAWAHLFKESGARYVVPVFEHHDGFQMYDSNLSDWTAVKMGPHRDLVGDLEKATRAEGLHFGASSHRIEHDWFMDGGRSIPSDVNDPKYAAFYGPAEQQLEDKPGGAICRTTGPMSAPPMATIGLRGMRKLSKNTTPTSSFLIGGSGNLMFVLI